MLMHTLFVDVQYDNVAHISTMLCRIHSFSAGKWSCSCTRCLVIFNMTMLLSYQPCFVGNAYCLVQFRIQNPVSRIQLKSMIDMTTPNYHALDPEQSTLTHPLAWKRELRCILWFDVQTVCLSTQTVPWHNSSRELSNLKFGQNSNEHLRLKIEVWSRSILWS